MALEHIEDVIAPKEWGDKMQRIDVPPAVDGSWDNLIHNQSNGRNTLLVFRDDNDNQRNRGDIPY